MYFSKYVRLLTIYINVWDGIGPCVAAVPSLCQPHGSILDIGMKTCLESA